MELAVSKIGQKVCHCFVLHYKNIKIVNSVQVQVARTREGVNILSTVRPIYDIYGKLSFTLIEERAQL